MVSMGHLLCTNSIDKKKKVLAMERLKKRVNNTKATDLPFGWRDVRRRWCMGRGGSASEPYAVVVVRETHAG